MKRIKVKELNNIPKLSEEELESQLLQFNIN